MKVAVVSDSLPHHRLNSPWSSPGQKIGVSSLSILQGIFPTQELNQVSLTSGRFFTSCVTKLVQIYKHTHIQMYKTHIYIYIHVI